MSWDDDDDDAEFGERGQVRAKTTGWQVVRRAGGYAGVVVGVLALAVGAVFAVNALGVAAKPGGFAAPAVSGPSVALPPVVTPTEQTEQGESVEGGFEPTEETTPAEGSGAVVSTMPLVDPDWTSRTAAATGIPERALAAYAAAHVAIAAEEPECGLDWTTIAAIGAIESGHGSHGSTFLDDDGNAQPPIIGRALDGNGVAKIADTDDGLFDGDDTWDRAVGPMQFIPSTWARWASDANGDGFADPNQIDDAALATARYLCASGSMTSPEGWRAGVYSYNHDNDYVDKVATVANGFAASVG